MENDETTAGSSLAPDRERPRQRTRRAAAPAPSDALATPAPDEAPAEAPAPPRPARGASRRGGGTAQPAVAEVAENQPAAASSTASSSRRSRRPAAQPAAEQEPVAEVGPDAHQAPAQGSSSRRRSGGSRPRRGQEVLPGLEDSAPPTPTDTSAAPEQPAIAVPVTEQDENAIVTLADDARRAEVTADADQVAPVAHEQDATTPTADDQTAAMVTAQQSVDLSPVVLETEPVSQSAPSGPGEERSVEITANLRQFFTTVPDPGDDALRPASFLAPLAVALRAAGVRPALAQPNTATSIDITEDGGLDVVGSLAGLDLEHATSTLVDSQDDEDDEDRDGEDEAGVLEPVLDGEEALNGERDEGRLGGRRRRRGRRGGRGGFAARGDQEGEEGPFGGEATPDPVVPQPFDPVVPQPFDPVVPQETPSVFSPSTPVEVVVPAAVATPAVAPVSVSGRSWRDREPRRPWLAGPPAAPAGVALQGRPATPVAPEPRDDQVTTGPERTREEAPLALDAYRPTSGDGGSLERILERQSVMLQGFLDRQSRLLEAVATNVTVLRRSIEDLAARQERLAAEQRSGMPRTGIFVDAPNVSYAADSSKITLDFSRMLTYLSRGREVVHAIAYAPVSDEARDGQRYEMQRFVAPFARKGFKMVTKPLKRFPDGTAKGNFDIELAIDIVTMSDRLDLVVLVSGDSDFSRLVELVQSKGVRVEVVAFASSVATELVHMADTFLDIGQHLDDFRQL